MKETPALTQKSFSNWLKTLSIRDITLFGGVLLFFVLAFIGYGSNSIQSKSFKVQEGHFEYLQKNKGYKELGYSYHLKLLESAQKHTIKADYASCLDLELFDAEVSKGDLILLTTEYGNNSLILSIKKGSTSLMDINCVHTKTDHISIHIPMFIALCILFLWWMQRKIKQDRMTL